MKRSVGALWGRVKALEERLRDIESGGLPALPETVAVGRRLPQGRPAAAKPAKRVALQQVPELGREAARGDSRDDGTQLPGHRRDEAAEAMANQLATGSRRAALPRPEREPEPSIGADRT